MHVAGVAGPSGAGKTTLIERLVPTLRTHGRVATVKSIHHDVEVDEPGKDTYRHRAAGAEAVVGVTPAAAFEVRAGGKGDDGAAALEPILDGFADRGIDHTVVEGFTASALPTIVVGAIEEGAVGGPVLTRIERPTDVDVAALAAAVRGCREHETAASLAAGLPDDASATAVVGVRVTLASDPGAWLAPRTDGLDDLVDGVCDAVAGRDGVSDVRGHRGAPVSGTEGRTTVRVGVTARNAGAAFAAASAARDRLADRVDAEYGVTVHGGEYAVRE